MPSDEYPAWVPEPDAPKTVHAEVEDGWIIPSEDFLRITTDEWRATSHYKAYVRPVIRDSLIEGNK